MNRTISCCNQVGAGCSAVVTSGSTVVFSRESRVGADRGRRIRIPGRGRQATIRRLIALLALGLGLAVTVPVLPASAAQPDVWSGPLADAGNSSDNPGEHVITASTARRVATAWTVSTRSPSSSAPVVMGGVVYHVVADNDLQNPRLLASSARTGATLWTLPLPAIGFYGPGLSAAGGRVIVPFDGRNQRGGVFVVDAATHRIVWTAELPPPANQFIDAVHNNATVTDGTHVFVWGSSNDINAYRLTDGALLWTVPWDYDPSGYAYGLAGLATGPGVVYTGGDEGIIAFDATSGRRLWTGAASGVPVVAGGRVFGAGPAGTVVAFPAAGCGKATCAPLWTSTAPGPTGSAPAVEGADASTLFVTYHRHLPGPGDRIDGVVARLSASTGKVQWTTGVGSSMDGLVRGGNTIWLINWYSNGKAMAYRILGYSATATGHTPLRAIPMPDEDGGFPQSLAIAGGTLFDQTPGRGALIGYRVPGT